MSFSEERSFPARPEAIGLAVAFVEAACAACAVPHDDALRLVLVAEELFTNTVVHGHQGGADVPVQMALQIDAAQLQLDYSDGAPPFDPLARGDALADAELEARRPGGLGLALVLRMAARVRYEHAQGRNRLQVVLARAAG